MKIPRQAKKVFTGEIFDIYQWPQKMFDGSTATFEMIKRPDTVQIIAIQDGKIITTKEFQPGHKRDHGLIGGRVDRGEKPFAAAKRELLEESGMISKKWSLIKKYEPVHKMEWTVYYYVARDCKIIAKQNLDAGEKITLCQKTFEQFVEDAVTLPQWNNQFVGDVLKMQIKGKTELAKFKKQIFGK
ncbi:MAG: NUDIX hydrolase [Candidatus Magasanikbacteria bacterium]|jgi:8-oxo-dGTP pyrophosphatase MutT (NUDIX family)